MKIVRHATAADFLARAQPWLLEAEAENNLVLGVALRFAETETDLGGLKYWATVEREGAVAGCAFRTPPFPVAMTSMPEEAIAPLAEDLRLLYARLPGVNGPARVAERFAREWTERRGGSWRPRMRLLVHRLTEVHPPDAPPRGALRLASESEIALIREWTEGFVHDTGVRDSPSDFAERVVGDGRVYVWDDGGPRCMVASIRGGVKGACINAVYTPDAFRRRGYATAAVAALSQQMLDAGKTFCCLYTDRANPTSNAIYAQVGYEPVREDVEIDFDYGGPKSAS